MEDCIQNIEQTCSACPSQWEGEFVDGRSFYVRYRHGWLSIDIDNEEVGAYQLGDSLDGVMSYNDMLPRLYAAYVGPVLREDEKDLRGNV